MVVPTLLIIMNVAACATMSSLPPRAGGLPLFGDTLKLLSPRTMASYQVDRFAEHGPLWRTKLLFQDAVVVTSAAALADLANEERRKPMTAFFPPQQKKLFGSSSLLVNSGQKHAILRRLVGQALTPAAVASYSRSIDTAATDCIRRCIERGADEGGIALADEMRRFPLRVGAQLMLGSKASGIDALTAELSTWSKGLVAPPLFFLPWSAAAKAMRARRRIVALLVPLIDEERAAVGPASDSDDASARPERGGTLLHRLVRATDEDGSTLEADAIVDNLLTLLFAGSDTTSSGLTSCLQELALSPALQAEVRTAVATRPAEEVDSMLDALVAEAHRLHPPAPFQMRLVGQDDLEVRQPVLSRTTHHDQPSP